MGADYYGLLGVSKTADDGEIKKAYRKMAMKHHPDRGGDPEEFKKISEAYEVLTDSQKREIYDQYGEEGLKDGFFPGGGGGGGAGGMPGYHPGNPEDIFAEFLRHMNGGGGGSMNRRPRKDPPHQMSLPCTLEELYTGRTKRMKISRRRIDASGAQREESETLNIDIKQGWKKGTKITFQEKGDEHPGRIPADIIFVVDEKPHATFTRDGNDLVHTCKVSLREALTGTTVELQTLDGRVLRLPLKEIVSPGAQKVVANEGMPISKTPGSKGNLRIKFEVLFPRQLSDAQKEVLRQALPAH